MSESQISELAPVLVVFFNRPDKLAKVIESLEQAKVTNIFFAGDGPRNEKDKSLVQECQRMIIEKFPNIPRGNLRFNEINQGCRVAVSNAIEWFFSKVDQGIILEDDCLPGPKFFEYLSSALKIYSSDRRVFSISATNPIKSKRQELHTYLSIYPQIWGWATWSERWKLYQRDFYDVDSLIEKVLNGHLRDWNYLDRVKFKMVWKPILKNAGAGKIDTWDYSMLATMWRNNFMAVQSSGNFIVNLGFSNNATHTTKAPKWAPREYWPNSQNSMPELRPNSDLDLLLSKEVYNCTFVQLAKFHIRLVLKKIGIGSK
jgi:hypothetical protein